MKKTKHREFIGSSWAINNNTSVYVLAVLILLIGFMSYRSIPKEQMPEVVIPTIMVATVYPGTSPKDIENLVTRPLEKQIKSINGVKKVSSNSVQDFSSVVVEFDTDVDVSEAKDKVKDAVDKAKSDLPTDLLADPEVREIDLSEIPIVTINISGDYSNQALKNYAELIQDRIESLSEITRVDIIGALDREIQINVDLNKMKAAGLTFTDIERGIAGENAIISAGSITNNGVNSSISVKGQFLQISDLYSIVLHTPTGGGVYLKDIAEIKDGFEEQESYARFNGKNVVLLNVIKKTGENLLDANDQIDEILTDLKVSSLPDDLKIDKTGDQSRHTRNTLEELNNTIIFGFILVTLVLMFFMGVSNAIFVAAAVPLSMMVSYIILPGLDFTMNMMVMFAFIFALGIIVDDAIVVVENTYRMHKTVPDIKKAAKYAAGEVFYPILSGTLTTLAPFFPLAFWPGIVGQFMHYMPVTIIIALFASLAVAYIINPVFAVNFMKKDEHKIPVSPGWKSVLRSASWFLIPAVLFHIAHIPAIGNFLIIMFIIVVFHKFVTAHWVYKFQHNLWPRIVKRYERLIAQVLKGRNPQKIMWGTLSLFIITMVITAVAKPEVVFFPDNDPSQINVLVKMPPGTEVLVTDSVAKIVEHRVSGIVGKDNPNVESIITKVALGADPNSFDRSITPEKAMVSVNFIESKFRTTSTTPYMNQIRDSLNDIAGAVITVEKNRMGPPTGKPINIELYSEDIDLLIEDSKRFSDFINASGIEGIQELKSDLQEAKPEIVIELDRAKANAEGVNTYTIGLAMRTSIYGKEVSKFKEFEDEYPIMLRYSEEYRDNLENILNMNITFRDIATGRVKDVPISSLVNVKYTSSYGGIRRVDNKRAITLSSEVVSGYNANEIIKQIQSASRDFSFSPGTTFNFTGEQENQQESMSFLSKALVISIGLIFFILISQFNSIGKTLIILSEIVLSLIGVLLGIVIFNMPVSIIMTGIGVVALGGIVVRNGILIVEFSDKLLAEGLRPRVAIARAASTRLTPVILTATATILGLIPLALGMNINFETLLTSWNPQIYFGGDNVMFWGPLSWTIVFGLSFATLLTLIFVPAMYLIHYSMKVKLKRAQIRHKIKKIAKA
ncbi:MAG: copper transporter [Bacteroidetes bacterium GWF2_43_63]|nr:MAG: copper transporter [Bacteroidetes bacterium GWE2_42_42]OFY52758.1 MAG: copper transporter [Bacteroidetes bacterium GWF2_43_63]HBG70042.1 copper transporter [Bacteroidales bacterium]HCB62352.1 copper transporter [Bacteroidales bacterium]HCY22461.1 copper transporter [Bacteroidales bacterium]